jgi:hypothetical protein
MERELTKVSLEEGRRDKRKGVKKFQLISTTPTGCRTLLASFETEEAAFEAFDRQWVHFHIGLSQVESGVKRPWSGFAKAQAA